MRTISSSGYMVKMSLKQQLDFKGSSLAFKGVVSGVSEPRHVQFSPDPGEPIPMPAAM